jgi:choline dehydrogenase-like flavoprotein
MRCSDRIIQRGAAKLGIRVIHVRKATLTKPRDERPSCHYCGNCMAGCDVVAKYDSANVQMFPAQSTGKLTILSDSVVSNVTLEDRTHVNGVRYRAERRQRGSYQTKSVVVSCACVRALRVADARSGQYRTAWKLGGQLGDTSPISLATSRDSCAN